MTPGPPALAVRVSLRHPEGELVERVTLCWSVPPSAADVLREVARRALAARRHGLTLDVDEAPDDVGILLRAAGFVRAAGFS